MDSEAPSTPLTVLADPTRARIVQLIRDAENGRALVGHLAETLELRQPTVSHHMRVLLDAGVVTRERDGRRVWYAIAPDSADRVSALLPQESRAAAVDVERIIDDLAIRYRGVLSRETVAHYVQQSRELLARDTGSTRFLSSRTAAFSADRLEAFLRSRDAIRDVPEVLFVCVQNAGRSQIAAGILRQLAGDRVRVHTAGSEPVAEVRVTVAAALDEIGVPLAGEFPKPLTDEAVRAADIVITMGCGDACPIYPGRRYLDWPVEDPSGMSLADVRVVRDDIEARVRALLAELALA